jgi:hypothetical protein
MNIYFSQYFGSGFIESGSGSSILGCEYLPIRSQGFYDQKLQKNLHTKLIYFWLIIAIYLSLGLHKRRSSYSRSLQLSKENIQHFKTWNFCTRNFFQFLGSFLPSWIRIHLPDWIQIQSESGSETLILCFVPILNILVLWPLLTGSSLPNTRPIRSLAKWVIAPPPPLLPKNGPRTYRILGQAGVYINSPLLNPAIHKNYEKNNREN